MKIHIREIDHVVIRAANVDAMARFYCDVLGCSLEKEQRELGLTQLRAGRSLIDLLQAGQYELRVAAKGFATAVFANVGVAVSQTANVDALLSPSELGSVVRDIEQAWASLGDGRAWTVN